MSALTAVIEAQSKNGTVIATAYAVSEHFKGGKQIRRDVVRDGTRRGLRQVFRRTAWAAGSHRRKTSNPSPRPAPRLNKYFIETKDR
jgi:hypothetical protein